MGIEIRTPQEDERELVLAMTHQAFNPPLRLLESIRSWPLDDMRVAVADGRTSAVLRVYRFGHFFGGRSVPAVGIGGVAVAAHARGKGIAETLMTESLRELSEQGFAISTLYPATVPLYRRCGYEYAGFRMHYRAPLDALPRGDGPPVEEWGDDDLDDIAGCYRRYATQENGLVDRPDWFWPKRVLKSFDDTPVRRYCVREDGRVTGYVIYTQEKVPDRAFGFHLECRDLVWTTPGSASALLAFAGRHRSTGVDLLWNGGAGDPVANLLPEQDVDRESWFRQMLRLIDVPAAFEARGYPPPLEAAAELQVHDPAFGRNDAGWRIEAARGAAKVGPAPGARARVDVASLGAMFSGMLAARDARRLGRLDADDETVASLDAMLAGPTPWINDWY